ncbi:MAG: hypothetical protein QM728_12770 [Gordonia sp. (in: high G+C Gram-positive bacteria)]|uniref:hypothetical protein n=1 Tax=Gordonia sp. (in: high G+C Gram-positive bacteria) TaxID=84139 RepID=UPI0039E29F47
MAETVSERAESVARRMSGKSESEEIPRSWYIVAAVLAALLVLTLVLALNWFRLWQVESARNNSLDAAKGYADTMFSYEPKNVDQKIEESKGFLIDLARKQFDEQVSDLNMAKNVKDNKIISKLTVRDAGVVTNTRKTSTVLLFLNQSVTSAAEPKIRVDPSRVQFTMAKKGGEWKINSIDIFTDDSLRNVVERQTKTPATPNPPAGPRPPR